MNAITSQFLRRLGPMAVSLTLILGAPVPGSAASESVSFETIVQGGSSGIQEPTKQWITDQEEWEAFWQAHQEHRIEPEATPEVDFETEAVIAVVLPARTGGFWVNIESVLRDEAAPDSLTVRYTVRAPFGKAVTLAFTQPHHMVRVPRPAGSVEFQRIKQPNVKKLQRPRSERLRVFALTESGERVVFQRSDDLSHWETVLAGRNERDELQIITFEEGDYSAFSRSFYRVRWLTEPEPQPDPDGDSRPE